MKRELARSTTFLLGASLVAHGAIATLVFAAAGTMRLPWAWAALGVFCASQLTMVVVVFRRDPDLAVERTKPGPGQPRWDRVVLALAGVATVAGFVAGPIDAGRLRWADTVPEPVRALGLVLVAAGMGLMTWAMRVNTFFSKVVRIQAERGHRVVSRGPYRFVRHPGYAGWFVFWTGFQLAIGSWLGLAASVPVHGAILWRTIAEDRFLFARLDGYPEYAARTRWRLVPGIW